MQIGGGSSHDDDNSVKVTGTYPSIQVTDGDSRRGCKILAPDKDKYFIHIHARLR